MQFMACGSVATRIAVGCACTVGHMVGARAPILVTLSEIPVPKIGRAESCEQRIHMLLAQGLAMTFVSRSLWGGRPFGTLRARAFLRHGGWVRDSYTIACCNHFSSLFYHFKLRLSCGLIRSDPAGAFTLKSGTGIQKPMPIIQDDSRMHKELLCMYIRVHVFCVGYVTLNSIQAGTPTCANILCSKQQVPSLYHHRCGRLQFRLMNRD